MAEVNANGKKTVISRDTLVPLSVVAGVAVLIFSLASAFVWLKTSLYAIDLKITKVEAKLDDMAKDAAALRDVRSWVKLLKAQNKDLNVPDF